MILEQLYLKCLSQASYLVGDDKAGEAAVVDPRRDVDVYLEEAEKRGLRIVKILLTHFHADFLAGHLELRERTGARICLGAGAEADYPFTPLSEEDVIPLGRVHIRVLETPGHTPESLCYVVHDGPPDSTPPHAVLTGDTLFIGDVGRPDLMASKGMSAEELASLMYDSLHGKLLELPDATLVYPGHGAGSSCGRSLSKETVSTIGDQRRFNPACRPMGREAFVASVTADQPAAPRYFAYDAELNRREHELLEDNLQRRLRPLDLAEVLELADQGACILDARDPDRYAACHLAGSLNIGLGGRYASWCGTLLDPDRSVVLVAPPGREREAAMRLGRIGFDRVAGYLRDGAEAFRDRPDLVAAIRRLPPEACARERSRSPDTRVLDVRTPGEWEALRIPESLNVPLADLEQGLDRIPRDHPLLVHCQSSYRSSIACSILERHGFRDLIDLRGGIAAWQAAGQEVEAPALA